MHYRFDDFFKRLLRRLLSGLGLVTSEVEVRLDAQRIDIFFVPTPGATSHDDLGLLGQIAASQCILEPFHQGPTANEVRGVVRKLLNWHHLQLVEAGRAARARRRSALATFRFPDRSPGRPPCCSPGRAPVGAAAAIEGSPESDLTLPPPLWIISPSRSTEVIESFNFHPLEGWPPGVYTNCQPGIPVRLVIAGELPATRSTLPLRLMGRGAVQRHAIVDLLTLPASSWERKKIAPLVLELDKKLAAVEATRDLTNEEQEIHVTGEQMLAAAERRGLGEGLEPLIHLITRKLGRRPTTPEQATVVRRLKRLGAERIGDVVLDLDPPALGAWLANPTAR